MPEPKPPVEEDELDELPAIDGDDGDADEADGPPEELDETPDDGGGTDPFDDSTGEGDPLEETEVSGEESGWMDDAEDSEALDVGTPEAFGAEEESSTLLEGADEPDDAGLDDELSVGGSGEGEERSLVGDAGEEGFEDEAEEVQEEELPRLDADHEDAEIDDSDLIDALPDEEVTEEPRPPWDDRAWERVDGGLPGLAAIDALACRPEGLLVAGQGLARIDRAGEVTALEARGLRGGAINRLGVEGDWIAVSTPRAGVLVSKDGGRSFAEANGWRVLVGADPAAADGGLDLVLVAGDLWGRARGGELVWSGDHGATWARAGADRRFEAIAGDLASGEVVALAREGAGTVLGRGAGGRLILSSQPATADGPAEAAGKGALPPGRVLGLAASGSHVVAALGRGAFRAEEGGWARLEGTAAPTAITFARDDGTLLVALHSEGESRAWILQARLEAPAFTVAELGDSGGSAAAGAKEDGEDGDDSRVRALAWDGVTGVVWAAGGFGLVALRPAGR